MTDCLTKSGDEACKCWNGLDDLKEQFKTNCNADEVKAERNLFKRDKEACVTQFQKCKKMEDDSVSVAAACSTGRQALYDAYTKAVSRVSSALTVAYNKIKEIYFNSRKQLKEVKQRRRRIRDVRAISDCDTFYSKVMEREWKLF